jgi:hypothetical protein
VRLAILMLATPVCGLFTLVALPSSLHPCWIILPFPLAFAFAVTITASTFRKYL